MLAEYIRIYDENKACMRINVMFSELFHIQQGVTQGCIMSLWLFNVFMDKCIRNAYGRIRGMLVGDRNAHGLGCWLNNFQGILGKL